MSRQIFFIYVELFEEMVKIAENKEKTSVFTEVSSWFRLELNQRHADFQSTVIFKKNY